MPENSAIESARLPFWPRLLPGQDCLLCVGACDEVVCASCARALPTTEHACSRCAAPVALAGWCGACVTRPPAFDDAAAAFEYRFPVDRLITRFKFSADLAIGRWLGTQLADRVRCLARPDVIVAPPLAPERLRERGFNQALELAKVVARDLGVPLRNRGLRRTRATAPQPGLGREARCANLKGAFACGADFRGLEVAIVYDVMTTGATAVALGLVLRSAGATRISVWVAARTPDPQDPGS